MLIQKGQRVRVKNDPYGGMAGTPVGTEGTATDDGEWFVGVKFDNGVQVKAWMVVDGKDKETLEVVQQ